MRNSILQYIFIIAVGATPFTYAAPPNPEIEVTNNNTVHFSYVGTTPTAHTGAIEFEGIHGLAAAARHCSLAFGPHARMATPLEVYHAGGAQGGQLLGHPKWVNANLITTATGVNQKVYPMDQQTGDGLGSGTEAPYEAFLRAHCAQWRADTNEDSGPTSSRVRRGCSSELHIACSAPVMRPGRYGPLDPGGP